jgi:chromosome segregation ATPase
MKALVALGIILIAGSVFAQQTQENLGDISKKEKERREQLAKEGKKGKVYTAEDLDRVKDKLAVQPGSNEAAESEATSSETEAAPEEVSSAVAEAEEQVEAVEKKLAELRRQRDEQAQALEDARTQLEASGGGARSANPAQTFGAVRDAQAKLDQIDANIAKTEQSLQQVQQRAEQARKVDAMKKEEAKKAAPPKTEPAPETPEKQI